MQRWNDRVKGHRGKRVKEHKGGRVKECKQEERKGGKEQGERVQGQDIPNSNGSFCG